MADFDYNIIRSRRRSLALEISCGRLIVRSPRLVPAFIIEKFVKSKKDWIKAKLILSAKRKPPKKIDSDVARRKIGSIVAKTIDKYQSEFKICDPKITYKIYRSKWGSCSAKNDLSFNLALAQAPDHVIEYVVVHELVHTKIKNHSKTFYAHLEKYLPDYKSSRHWLRKNHTLHYL